MMDQENIKYLVDMAKSLAEMNGKMTMLCERIASHETRLTHLEERACQHPADNHAKLLGIALKAILFATATAMALAGAGKFLTM